MSLHAPSATNELRLSVLDLETVLSPLAAGSLRASEGASIKRLALNEIAAACVLSFDVSADGLSRPAMWSGRAAEHGEQSLLAALDGELSETWRAGGLLVTHNGVLHDLPVCMRRCAHHGMFHATGLAAWQDARGRHADTMRLWGGRGEALEHLCAGLGIPASEAPAPASAPLRRLAKCEFDVAATAVLWMHHEAFRRGGVRWLATCWSDLGSFLLSRSHAMPHLVALARRGVEIAHALEGER